MNCEHNNFITRVSVARLVEQDNEKNVTGYAADIRISCDECGMPFEFIGLPGGLSFSQPMVNFDRTELRAPLKPSTDPVEHAKVLINKSI